MANDTGTWLVRLDEVPPDGLRRAAAGGRDLLVVRAGDAVHVLSNVCPHAGASLHQGTLAGCILTCPWHGSQFDVCAGTVRRGPATAPPALFASRVEDGWVVVQL